MLNICIGYNLDKQKYDKRSVTFVSRAIQRSNLFPCFCTFAWDHEQ